MLYNGHYTGEPAGRVASDEHNLCVRIDLEKFRQEEDAGGISHGDKASGGFTQAFKENGAIVAVGEDLAPELYISWGDLFSGLLL